MQFVIIAEHAPDLCPSSNSKTREMMRQGAAEFSKIAERLGVRIVTTNVIGPAHKVISVVEAADIDAVTNFTMESRLVQWNTVNIYTSWTVAETLERADRLPAMF